MSTPRRASSRWLEGAPDFVLSCHDSGAGTIDRYTVFFCKDYLMKHPCTGATIIPYLSMSGAPEHPQGFSQWGEVTQAQRAQYLRRFKDMIRWQDLPAHIRKHVEWRATEADSQ